jgi:RNA polymerase sigma-70 factor (ECF subfamily)
MADDEPSSIQTRSSLLARLQQGDDTEGWCEFYRIYGKLVRDFAIGSGLTDTEADEVVQDTAVAMARHLPDYRYDPKACRFKTWLLNQASWRIRDQLRKRARDQQWKWSASETQPAQEPIDTTDRTPIINRVPDPSATDLSGLFEAQWRKNLFQAAFDRVKATFNPKQIQIFDLVVLKEWRATDVAKSLGVTVANVYVTRHRVSTAIRKTIKRFENQFEDPARR